MYFFHPLARLERKRKKCLKSFLPAALQPLQHRPIWNASTHLWDIEFLALDFETTGLDFVQDVILSMGWVVIRNGKIDLETATKIDVCRGQNIKPETAVINHIVPETLVGARSINQAMQKLMMAMKGRVLIAHSAVIERGFFNQYCHRAFGCDPISLVWLDTMQIEKSIMSHSNTRLKSDCRLSAVRADYGLPAYPGHDALIDAVAAGELFLAQVNSVFGGMPPQLGALVERS